MNLNFFWKIKMHLVKGNFYSINKMIDEFYQQQKTLPETITITLNPKATKFDKFKHKFFLETTYGVYLQIT